MTQFWVDLDLILIGIVIVAVAAVLLGYLRDIRAARQRLDSLGSQVVATACGPVEYTSTGTGFPLLVVHGAMGGFDQGLWLAHSFDLTGYQVISISRFGYLGSPVPAGANLDAQADAFAALLDALNIPQAAVFAASAGSTSAIRFAARHPQRVPALILLCPDAPGKVQLAIPSRFIFDTLLRSDFVYWVLVKFFWKWMQNAMGLVPRGYVPTPETVVMLKKMQLGDLPVSRRMDGMVFESFTTLVEYNASVTPSSPYPLTHLETPVQVINAVDDPIVSHENVCELAGQLPDVHKFFVPDGGHFFFGHTEEVKTEIDQFLRSHVSEMQTERGILSYE
jgi:pimeloyl-ACP methyl ester carboxylesterase